MTRTCIAFACLLSGFALPLTAQNRLLFSEIMYHPVENEAFDSNGLPVLDLTEDVHEFVELHNAGTNSVTLDGWRLTGGITYDFPSGISVAPGGFLVIAKDPARLTALPQYALTTNQLLGPWSGKLANSGDTIRLRDSADTVVDGVSYSASFPWAIGADALGADDEWTGLVSSNYQYRGRSLERVSFGASPNDPANWLASPLATGPTPRRTNSVQLPLPRPVVTAFTVVQAANGATLIGANQTVRLDVTFSATNQLSAVAVEFFVDDINSTNEIHVTNALTAVASPADGRYTGTMPGQPDRSVVRFRIRADRGAGSEAVSPRADDPFGWHAWFVTPVRAPGNPAYDCFISAASLNTLATNIAQSPRRILLPDPPGTPRSSWDATEPAIFIYNGEVFDIRMRHHGSRYNRNVGRNSFKWQFPRYHPFTQGRDSVFITDKGEEHRVGAQLYDAADLPAWRCRYVNVYLNNNTVLQRLEQEEMERTVYERWAREQAAKHPGQAEEALGGIFKATGVIPFETGSGQNTATYLNSGEGPYYIGNCTVPPAKTGWNTRQRCEWTYTPQIDGWKGGADVEQLLTGLWAARGDSPLAPAPNLPALRTFLAANFDVDRTLTYMAIRDWSGPFDNATHNYFLWRLADGRWSMLAWDLDSEFDNPPQTIFWDEQVPAQPDPLRGPHWIKDSFFKAYREEYKQKLWLLNNTLLHPATFATNGWGSLQAFANSRLTSVNQQLGLGTFQRPAQPVNLTPASNTAAFPPASLTASAYAHSDPNPPPHDSTTWILRRADGGYTNPVIRVTSRTNLISLPIPFEELTFGATYFWKCLYTDTNGHPSLESVESPFVFGAAPLVVPLVAIDAGTSWRYNQSGTNPPADWLLAGFDDGAWPQGAALLADETAPLPEPIRTPLLHTNFTSWYFRTRFFFNGDTAGATLRLRQIIDDGVVVYLNGTEVSRTRMPAGAVTYSTAANAAVNDAVYEGPIPISAAALVTGTNVLAAEVHQAAVSGNDLVFGLSLDALVPSAPGAVRLSEVLANNNATLTNGGYTPGYIELANVSGVPQSLDSVSLSDDPARPGRFIFPSGVVIPPQGFLVAWCDDHTNAPGWHTGFRLDNDGQTVALFAVTPGGYLLTDTVKFGPQLADKSIGRVGLGPGVPPPWVLTDPTPSAANVATLLGSTATLKINEWLASSTTGPDWFELFNPDTFPVALDGLYLSDSAANRTNTRVAPLTFIAPRGFRQFIADEDPGQSPRHVDFKLSAGGESILLSAPSLAAIDTVNFGAQTAEVSQGRLPDGASTLTNFPGSASPEAPNHLLISNVQINELAPDIELLNPTGSAVDVSGWWFSDDAGALRKYSIPGPISIAPGGYWRLDHTNLPFVLDTQRGGRIFLSHDDVFQTSAKFGPYDGHPYGTVPTSVGVEFVRLSVPTFAATNAPPEVGPVVVSEIQYHPPALPSDNDDYEFMELANISGAPAALFLPGFPSITWRLRDAVSFSFPSSTTLATGERVLVLPFDAATNTVALSNFLAVYEIAPGTRLFGPYSGHLDNAGASVELVQDRLPLSTPGAGFGDVPSIVMDRVHYSDAFPWPTAADGTGPSLQRRLLNFYGNEPTNWFASGVSPGAVSSSNLPPSVLLSAPTNGANLPYGQPLTLVANASDPDGQVRRVDFFVDGVSIGQGTGPSFTVTWSNALAGPHLLTARATDNRLGIANSPPVNVTVVNQLPTVTLTSPPNGASFALPTNILLSATAGDTDGSVLVVEFFDNGLKVGEDTNSPYSFLWTNAPPGTRLLTARAIDDAGGVTTSPAVTVTNTRVTNIAYIVPAGTIGTQTLPNPYAIGMDFDVVTPILVTRLGCFDSASDGLNASSTLTTQIYNRNGPTPVVVATMSFSSGDAGALLGGSRFKALPNPIVLTNGSYSCVGYGYDGNNRNGNLGTGNAKVWTTDDSGALNFTGGGRYGANSPGGFPGTLDGGPVDRYAAGTFEFRTIPAAPLIITPPADVFVRPGTNATNSVVAVGNAPLRYQWSLSGTNLPGATNATLIIINAQTSNEGLYRVVVTNASGAATSPPASLVLLVDPLIVQSPISQNIIAGSTITLSVTVTNTATLPVGYRLRRNNATLPTTFPGAYITLNDRSGYFTLSGTNVAPPWTSYAIICTNVARPSGLASPAAILTYVADSDGDGLPDEWELQYFGSTTSASANLDADADGMLNGQEYIAGTDPTNASSYLKIESIVAGATLTFGAVSNKTYTVQFTEAAGSGAWFKLLDVPARPTNRVEMIHDDAVTTNRIYRLVTPQQTM